MKKLKLSPGKRNALDILIISCLAVLLVAVNLLLPFAMQRSAAYLDLTPEGLYTLTRAMKEELSEVAEDIELIFCADPDYLMANSSTRPVYIMCQKVAREIPSITLRHIDVVNDPGVAAPYKQATNSSINWNDLIVTYGEQYKVLSADSFFGSEHGKRVTFNGEYRLASTIFSLTALPSGAYAYFAFGHGERYYAEGDAGSDPELSAFADLLGSLGIGTRKISLDTEEIPDDCVLLILCGTNKDYSGGDMHDFSAPSTIAKIDEYLSSRRSVMVLRDALSEPLPNLDEFLSEWGIRIESTLVSAPETSLVDGSLIATYPIDEDGKGAVGHAMIAAIADLASPPKMIFERPASLSLTRKSAEISIAFNISRFVEPLFFAGEDAKATNADGITVSDKQAVPLAVFGIEAELGSNGEKTMSYLLAAGTTSLISNTYLSDGAYGNGDIMYAILRDITRTDRFASSAVGGLDINTDTYGGKAFADTDIYTEDQDYYMTATGLRSTLGMTSGRLWFAIFLTLLPVLAAPISAFVILRRRRGR